MGQEAAITPVNGAFLDRLRRYGDKARAALLERIPADEPYSHLYGPMRDFIGNSGKGLRPALLIATCKAFGGREEDALPAAAVIELLHNAFLIHDDVEDVSEFRRGRLCLHHEIGVPLAINMGDAMQAMALRILRHDLGSLGPDTAARVVDEFDHLLKQSLEGQALELGMIRDNNLDIGPQDYLRMTLKKTCWYSFIHPCRIGALIALPHEVGERRLNLDDFNEFGFFLGAAFQIQDDVLNLVGSQAKYGKEIRGDIYEGKRTLMLSKLARNANEEERGRLQDFLAKPRAARAAADVDWVMERMRDHDCIGYARRAASELLDAARASFGPLYRDARAEDRQFLSDCMDYMISRDL